MRCSRFGFLSSPELNFTGLRTYRSVAFPKETSADLGLTSNTHLASATSLAHVLNLRTQVELMYKTVLNLGIQSPEYALYRL